MAAQASIVEDEEGADTRAEELGESSRAYEREYVDDRSWEDLREDEHGRLQALDPRMAQRSKRRRLLGQAAGARIRRGLIRYLQLVIDCSRAAAVTDFRPTRISLIAGILTQFVRDFFEENPLSHLGIIILRGGVAEKLTDLSGNPDVHIRQLESLEVRGDASLQNGIDAAVAALRSVPPYGHREVLVIMSALSTVDPGDIMASIKAAAAHRVRASLVSVAAHVRICETLAKQTGGIYNVALDEQHLDDIIRQHIPPPPTLAAATSASMVRMGFPQRNEEGAAGRSFLGSDARLAAGGFTCPRCRAIVAELPGSCHVCALTLVSSPHLAQSYHHLFPVPPFKEVPHQQILQLAQTAATSSKQLSCHSCCSVLWGDRVGSAGTAATPGPAGVILRCEGGCRQIFCFDCDVFIHVSLHVCPGCEEDSEVQEGRR